MFFASKAWFNKKRKKAQIEHQLIDAMLSERNAELIIFEHFLKPLQTYSHGKIQF